MLLSAHVRFTRVNNIRYKIQVSPTGLKADPMRSFFDSSQGLFLHIRTKCPHRENQWFQLTSLRKALGLTGQSVSKFIHRLKQLTQDSVQKFSSRFFITHNLLIKSEAKRNPSRPSWEKRINPILSLCGKTMLHTIIGKNLQLGQR